ncbi:MAG: regulator of protease activity HflC (stomatin/prohibitin superfamily) [Urechidicola sp.]|jgi:regulator of protease activity HflC (stomatin/prohibitin superfamily)|tara:strand:- start:234 stop:1184 length:951 start_codon:yes stop_codon:yes gene_type:complete
MYLLAATLPSPGIIILIVLAIVLIVMSIVIVPEKSAKVIQRLGKFNRVAFSGLSFKIPIIDSVTGTVNLRVLQLDVHVETKTQDNVFVNMQASVQYKVIRSKTKESFYSLDDSSRQISSFIFDVIRAEVPKLELDHVFSRKDDIAVAVNKSLSASMDDYGFEIIKTLITDIDPDKNVKESMNRINAAKRDKEAIKQEAEASKIRIIKEAEADAESKRLQGEGVAAQRIAIVKGFKESIEDFKDSLDEINSSEVMQFVLLTQYFDTLNSIGTKEGNNTILVPHSPGGMKDFQQQIIEGTVVGQRLSDSSSPSDKKEK